MNGVDLEYLEAGTGTPVVFSHGAGCDLRYWEPQRESVAARYRFVAYSQRYHGRGPWPADGDASAEAHTRDLVAVLRGLDGPPAHLVGFSTAIALRAALRAPDLIRSLTVIEPNLPWLLQGDAEGKAVLAAWRAENARLEAEAAGDRERRARLWFELVDNAGAGAFDAQPEAFQRMWFDNFGLARPTGGTPAPVTCDDLHPIGVPTLALGGGRGMHYSRAILDRLAHCIPDCELVIVPGATHFMSYQEPTTFNRQLLDFLALH
ncbi:MAG TPA: alpha/beta hydrolase [Candidatus Limnocylindrales bacterium]|nr:alpha/beta hydrolase [Candidatus Limnocylindrales bacterium]